jgi:hypothetical protein
MNGAPLTLGLLGALAAAGVLSSDRGSSARARPAPIWERPEVVQAMQQIWRLLDLKDVRVSEKGEVYLLASARKLESFLHGAGRYSVSHMLTSSGMRRDDVRSYVDDLTHWDGLASSVQMFFQNKGVQFNPSKPYSDWSVEVIPEPGRPSVRTWSAAKGKVIDVESVKPFRFCEQPAVDLGNRTGPVLLSLEERGIPPLFLSHGVTLEGLDEVVRCGGFLWPSLALTWRVPEGYGDVVFLADTGLLPQILRPSGTPSSHKHLYLAGTDIWSPTSRELAKEEVEIFKQLRGQADRGLQDRLLISQVTKADWESLVGSFSYFGGNEKVTDRIQTRSTLVRTMRSVLQEHTHGSTPYVYPQARHRRFEASHRYPYAELKVVGVVEPKNMVACLYPAALARRVHARLDKLGFEGFRIPFAWNGGSRTTWNYDEKPATAWAASATNALLSWAERPCAAPGVRVGPGVLASSGVPEPVYDATLSFYDGFRRSGGHGIFRWTHEQRGKCPPASPKKRR